MANPIPFEIVEGEGGMRVASNGVVRLTLLDGDGRTFKRRGIKGSEASHASSAAAE